MPAPLDCVLTVMLVAVLRSATRAPGTLAPDVSVTVPLMVPCSPCANSGADAINRASERPTWFRILINSPWSYRYSIRFVAKVKEGSTGGGCGKIGPWYYNY